MASSNRLWDNDLPPEAKLIGMELLGLGLEWVRTYDNGYIVADPQEAFL